ncbi:MAG: Asp-tRNA(Asn)/Glu-tRNA(Gln) amidotransferase subunit GatA [Clostridia bacterium]|nr:Asp-tRNA(Asn)/Glu-tRNA(Gln) amidotransferase subunit GatA [Clostridia bacterium]
MSILKLSVKELRKKITNKEISVPEVVKAQLAHIEKTNPLYNAYHDINKNALLRAETVQKEIEAGTLDSAFAGVPVAVKDNICTTEMTTTCGSKMLTGFHSPYNATVVKRLQKAGAVIMGKANMDEFAMGSTSETCYYGAVKNPWNPEHVSGGSSGGSAVAVASYGAFASLGSDTGGSIRQPAAYCNMTGVKPTYGSVSRFGLVAYGSSLDQIGPIAHNIEDAAAMLAIISGYDDQDSTSLKQGPFDFNDCLKEDLEGKKIGIPVNYLGEGIDPEIKAAIYEAAKKLSELGAECEEFILPMVDYAVPAYYIIASAEASSNLSRFDGIKYGYHPKKFTDLEDLYLTARSEGFGMEVKRRIMLGTFALSSGYYDAYYQKALKVKALIKQAFDGAFAKYDTILSPVAPTVAPKLGESLNNLLQMYLSDIYTVSVNLAGIPAVSLPCGFNKENLPIGMQFLGQALSEKTLVQLAYAYQSITEHHHKKPQLEVL